MTTTQSDVLALWKELEARVAAGDRFAGLFATRAAEGQAVTLSAHVATAGDVGTLEVMLPRGAAGYPALTPLIGAAFWYERVIHDQFGLVPEGHPRLAPLLRPGYPLPRHWRATDCSRSRTARSAPGSWNPSSTWSRRRARPSRT